MEELERERQQLILDHQSQKGEFDLFKDKIRTLEDELRIKVGDLENATREISQMRETNSNLEL